MTFLSEYETRLADLKLDFLSIHELIAQNQLRVGSTFASGRQTERAWTYYQNQRQSLSQFWCRYAVRDDWIKASSLIGMPSQALASHERTVHRIWLGGELPALAHDIISQWSYMHERLAMAGAAPFIEKIWVWDELQLTRDAGLEFQPSNSALDSLHIGYSQIGRMTVEVASLRRLTVCVTPSMLPVFQAMMDDRCFVHLSDYFRLLVLHQQGGLYLDVDSLPADASVHFLIKPELPDFQVWTCNENRMQLRGSHMSWINGHADENGVLSARKGDAALRQILSDMEIALQAIVMSPAPSSAVRRQYWQQATYDVWRRAMGTTYMAHSGIIEKCALWYLGGKRSTAIGLLGMRLMNDPITGQYHPLTDDEIKARAELLNELERRKWSPDCADELPRLGTLILNDESPRLARPAQLRSDVGDCHYYSFLNSDEDLSRVNEIFSRYLVRTHEAALRGDVHWFASSKEVSQFLSPYNASLGQMLVDQPFSSVFPVRFTCGRAASISMRELMARLLFSTSYLEFCSYGNKLGLGLVALQRQQNIDPYLDFIEVMQDQTGKFLGFFNAGCQADYQGISATSYYRDDMQAMDDAYDSFVDTYWDPEDLFVCSLAIDESVRGKGLFHLLLARIRERAIRLRCKRIILTVWESNPAINMYEYLGFERIARFDYAYPVFFDHLHLLGMPVERTQLAPHHSVMREDKRVTH